MQIRWHICVIMLLGCLAPAQESREIEPGITVTGALAPKAQKAGSATQAAPAPTMPATTITRTYHALCSAGNKEVLVFGTADDREPIATLRCGEKLTAINDDYASTPVRVHTKHGIEGYVSRANLTLYGYDPQSDDNKNYVTEASPQQKLTTSECVSRTAPSAPAELKSERDKTLPVVLYTPKHVSTKTPGGAFGAMLGATTWKVYPVIAYAYTANRSVKALGLRIDFGTGGRGEPLIPQALWFYIDEQKQLQQPIHSGDMSVTSPYMNAYRIQVGGQEVEDFARTLATADGVTIMIFNDRIANGRFDIKLRKSDLSSFAPALAFYDSIPCPSRYSDQP